MKTLLVTSQITYVPQNYLPLFDELFERAAPHIVGLVVLKVLSFNLLKQIGWLYWTGCKNIANSLSRNMIELPLKKRESLFQNRGLPVLRAKSMNDPKIIDWVRENGIDVIVNLRTRGIYQNEILNAPRLGCVNIHHGILPTYRGTLCDLYALSENRPAGFTVHKMNEEIDSGRILIRKEVSSGMDRDYVGYLSRTSRDEGQALAELLDYVNKTNALPEGIPNHCEEPIVTKTPQKRSEIRQLQEKGMIL